MIAINNDLEVYTPTSSQLLPGRPYIMSCRPNSC